MCPPSWGLGACPQKKKQFCAKNYAILSKFWYFFPIYYSIRTFSHATARYQRIKESGGLSPVLTVGRPISLPPPPAPTPMIQPLVQWFLVLQEFGALQTLLVKHNRRLKQRDSLPLNAAIGSWEIGSPPVWSRDNPEGVSGTKSPRS